MPTDPVPLYNLLLIIWLWAASPANDSSTTLPTTSVRRHSLASTPSAFSYSKANDTRVPEYDHKGKLRSLLDILANKGKKDDAIKYAVILRDLPGIYDLI